jgi:enoyl-CoA hydratase
MPSWGLSQKLPRLIGANRAREVSLTALPLDARTAEKWGLISRAVEPGLLLQEAKRIAAAIIKNQVTELHSAPT